MAINAQSHKSVMVHLSLFSVKKEPNHFGVRKVIIFRTCTWDQPAKPFKLTTRKVFFERLEVFQISRSVATFLAYAKDYAVKEG